jgi:hypothetical protein
MGDGQAQYLAHGAGARKRSVRAFNSAPDPLRPKLERRVAQHCARQQTSLEEDLEPIADPEHQATVSSEFLNAGHDWREAGNGASPKMVAVREATRQHYSRVATGGKRVGMPDHLNTTCG